ncbi:T9SS type A sorting domain-containing protein, partial [Crocinitomix catalasitica]|nr:T9SS type A sorting domain-containing protein [Crocinitomix catalasitica]
ELDPGGVYYETQLGGLWYDSPGTGSMDVGPPVFGSDRVNWDMPYLVDEDAANLFVGTSKVQIMEGAPFGFYTDISGDLTELGFGSVEGLESKHTISELEQDKFDDGIMYAGTTDGQLWRGEGSGTSWSWFSVSGTLPDKYVTALRASPNNPNTIFVGFSGFRVNDFESYIYRSDDKGVTWTDISSNLPSISVNDILLVPNYNDEYLFAALDGGVYFSSNSGGSWDYLGTSLPLVTISELDLDIPNEKLIAGTYARSIWSYDISWLDSLDGTPFGTGIVETATEDFFSYPNPVDELLYFRGLNINEIQLYDISGRFLGSKKVMDFGSYQQINLSVLPSGNYIIQVGDRRKKIVVK